MDIFKHKLSLRTIAVFLIIVMLIPINAYATLNETVDPRASDYLNSYNTYIYPSGLGKIQVWFSVTGVEYMDDIGALTIQIYESSDNETWTWKKTYRHDSTADMLGHDDYFHSGYVEYSGTIGRYYKAYVCIWAGKDGAGDTRYMWTLPKKATLFAG